MKKMIIALFATTALAVPAFAANNAANQPQSSMQQQQSAGQQQSKAKPHDQQQQAQNGNEQNGNQPVNNLSRSEVRQMQSALDKQGFKAGKPDGKLGPHTRQALEKFDQKKGIQSNNGQPTEQALAQLGVNQNQDQNQQPQDQSQPQNGNGQTGNGQTGNGQ